MSLKEKLKFEFRCAYNRSRAFRKVAELGMRLAGKSTRHDLGHLNFYSEDSIGPLQADEAIFLYGLVRVIRPRTLVEFGFFTGRSAYNLLQAMDPEARLYCFDIMEGSQAVARKSFGRDGRVTFHLKSQADFAPADIENRQADFVFIDAAHDLALNQETFRRLEPVLSPDAVVAIHDTGLWEKSHFGPRHQEHAQSHPRHYWLSASQYAHQPDEREFVNWVMSEYPALSVMHFHSRHTVRHGLTLLQRRTTLPTAAPDDPLTYLP